MTQLKIINVYADLTKISIAIFLFLVSPYANSTLKFTLIISSLALAGFFAFNMCQYYFRKFYNSHKVSFLFIFFAIILIVIFYFVYLKTGFENGFIYSLVGAIIAYLGILITVLCKS